VLQILVLKIKKNLCKKINVKKSSLHFLVRKKIQKSEIVQKKLPKNVVLKF